MWCAQCGEMVLVGDRCRCGSWDQEEPEIVMAKEAFMDGETDQGQLEQEVWGILHDYDRRNCHRQDGLASLLMLRERPVPTPRPARKKSSGLTVGAAIALTMLMSLALVFGLTGLTSAPLLGGVVGMMGIFEMMVAVENSRMESERKTRLEREL